MNTISPFITTTNPFITATNPFITTTNHLLLLLSFLLLLLANLLLLLSLLLLLNYSNTICILLLNFQIYLLQVFKITKHTLNLIDYFCRCINYAIFQITT